MKILIRELLLGKRAISSRREYKYAVLRAQFAVIVFFVATFYVMLDTINGVRVFIPWYIFMAFVSVVIMILNRNGYYGTATTILLTLINSLIFVFADVDHPIGGVFFFFITSSVAALALLGYYNQWAGIFFAVIPIALGVVAYLFDFDLIDRPIYSSPGSLSINFISNFSISLISTFFCVHFLITRNREFENSLLESEQHLLKVSNDLKKSEERYSMALNGTRAGIYEWDIKKNVVYVSEYWKTLLGYHKNELTTNTLEGYVSMVHPDDAARTSKLISDTLAGGEHYQTEVRIRRKDGQYIWFQDSGIIKRDEKGQPEVAVGSIIDIRERKQAEEKILQQNELLAKANQELDHFVYSVSHDLRAPLSSILGLTSIYKLSTDVDEKESIIKMINDRAQSLDSFIREVLDYSRNTRMELKLQHVMVQALIQEVLEGLSHMQGFSQVAMQLYIDPSQEVITDRERAKVVFANLLSNAVTYRDPEKRSFASLHSTVKDRIWTFRVRDNGIGIKTEHQGKIFNMFYKAHDRANGTGLGLYIVKETLQRLGGSIALESTFGAGSEFIVTIPVGGKAQD